MTQLIRNSRNAISNMQKQPQPQLANSCRMLSMRERFSGSVLPEPKEVGPDGVPAEGMEVGVVPEPDVVPDAEPEAVPEVEPEAAPEAELEEFRGFCRAL